MPKSADKAPKISNAMPKKEPPPELKINKNFKIPYIAILTIMPDIIAEMFAGGSRVGIGKPDMKGHNAGFNGKSEYRDCYYNNPCSAFIIIER